MASSGACRIDHQPSSAARRTSAKTRNLLRTEKSMMRLIMELQADYLMESSSISKTSVASGPILSPEPRGP